jgi:hypothetical protein
MREHDFEPIRGLPGDLPAGERILWQGAPRWTSLAADAFHIRVVAAYFLLMFVFRTAGGLQHGEAPAAVLGSAALASPPAFVAVGMLALLAWLYAKTTVYTITNKRVVVRFGVAITKAINLPFTVIEGAALKTTAGGSGDVALKLKSPTRVPFFQVWPNVRPWRLSQPEPTLRGVADAASAADILAQAMRAEVGIEMTPQTAPVRERPVGLGRPNAAAA